MDPNALWRPQENESAVTRTQADQVEVNKKKRRNWGSCEWREINTQVFFCSCSLNRLLLGQLWPVDAWFRWTTVTQCSWLLRGTSAGHTARPRRWTVSRCGANRSNNRTVVFKAGAKVLTAKCLFAWFFFKRVKKREGETVRTSPDNCLNPVLAGSTRRKTVQLVPPSLPMTYSVVN